VTRIRLDGDIPPGPERRRVLALALMTLAAGCDSASPTAEAGKRADIVIATAAEGGSVTVDGQMPDFAPVFPRARVVSRISGIDGAGAGSVVVMETDAAFADVVAFYDRAAAKARASAAMRVDKEGKAIRMFRGRGETEGGTILVIEQGDGDRPTRIVLTSGVTDLGIEGPAVTVAGPLPPPPGTPASEAPARERTAERKPPASDVRLQ
jgi:hypothetical protein